MTYLKTEGTFTAEIIEPEGGWLGAATNTGTEFIRVDLKVVEDAECEGELITWTGWLSEAAFEKSIASLAKATGWDGNMAALNAGKSGLVGKRVQIVTEIEEYKGKQRLRIKWLNPPKFRPAPVESSKLTAMLTRWNDKAMAAAKAAKSEKVEAKPVAAVAAPENDPSDPDYCPF